ncbi:hypothetical protein IFM89_017323 [Coptis chinensis]|uniref:RING-type E3 ubiquitin transferase n=1 Tax=Coptis chinensis TaxID=261450 RepID=A0A835H967_9MAGN|nr:hypothetical protein IFM89_017323 [Coptis chinensis]
MANYIEMEDLIVKQTICGILSPTSEEPSWETIQECIRKIATLRAIETGEDFETIRIVTQLSVAHAIAYELERRTLLPVVIVDSDICPICHEDMEEGDEAGSFECLHTFHQECMLKWIITKPNCPICRFERDVN